jgi:hypothetical protein
VGRVTNPSKLAKIEQAGRTAEVKRVNPERGHIVDADGLENDRKAAETGSR